MMKEYFDIEIFELQNATKWALESAEKSLNIFEKLVPFDDRPRKAIEGAIEFYKSGNRTNHLRKISLNAYRCSKETKYQAASYAANAASLAASLAFTHPYKDIRQAEHILGPVVYTALTIEIEDVDQSKGDEEIERAITTANNEIAILLLKYPEHRFDKYRLKELFYKLDYGIRNKFL